jgi:hypothetical protein
MRFQTVGRLIVHHLPPALIMTVPSHFLLGRSIS